MPIVTTSTSAFFERARGNITALRTHAEDVQSQLSRGERLSRSSDDPVAAARLRSLTRADTLSKIDTANANRASADLSLADAALADFADIVMRAQELATQGASSVLNSEQRKALGAEIQTLNASLFTLSNARDSTGHALFGGETGGAAYTLDAAGNASYTGTPSPGELPLGEGLSVQRGLTGPEFLNFTAGGTPGDLMATMKTLADTLISGSGDPLAASRSALDQLGAGLETITTAQTVVGSRLAWIDMTTERRTNLSEARASEQADLGGTDIAATVAHLQEAMVVLEASQASFGKLAQLSLFDVLR